jgi:hypothetical protein
MEPRSRQRVRGFLANVVTGVARLSKLVVAPAQNPKVTGKRTAVTRPDANLCRIPDPTPLPQRRPKPVESCHPVPLNTCGFPSNRLCFSLWHRNDLIP